MLKYFYFTVSLNKDIETHSVTKALIKESYNDRRNNFGTLVRGNTQLEVI